MLAAAHLRASGMEIIATAREQRKYRADRLYREFARQRTVRLVRAGGRASVAGGRSLSYCAEQLLSDFAADKLGRRLHRPQWRLWPWKQ